MIGAHDRLALPDGVVQTRDGLYDSVRDATVPVNAAGRIVLASPTPAAAAEAVAARFGVDRARALADVLAFCRDSNARLLLNATPRLRAAAVVVRWLVALPALLSAGSVPQALPVRHGVDTASPLRLVATAARALASAAVAYGVCAAALAALTVASVGGGAAIAGATGAATAIGVVVHELGHLAALAGVRACVVVRGFRVAVVHRAVGGRRAAAVAAAGPVAGLAAAALAAATVTFEPEPEVAAAAVMLALHAFGLTVVTRDGRRLCGLH